MCDCYFFSNGAFHISRPYTFLGEKNRFVLVRVCFAMADFDAQQAQAQARAHQFQFDQDQACIAFLDQNVANISKALQHIQNVLPPPPPQRFHPNLNLSPPPPFSGSPLHLPTFKMKLYHFLVGEPPHIS